MNPYPNPFPNPNQNPNPYPHPYPFEPYPLPRKLFFRIVGGEIVPEIGMEPWETIYDLKSKIEDKYGLCVHRQRLWFQGNELKNDNRIVSYGFRCNQTFHLTVEKLPPDVKLHILIKHPQARDNGYVRVWETAKVSDLRRKVAKYWSVPPESFTLFRFNIEMKDDCILREYYITEDCEIKFSTITEARIRY